MYRSIALVIAVAALGTAIVPSALAQVSITERAAAESKARSVVVHRTKNLGTGFKRSEVTATCRKRRAGYWACAVHARSPRTTTICDGRMRLYGSPGSFKARNVLIACPA
jgi:hypothetical protein